MDLRSMIPIYAILYIGLIISLGYVIVSIIYKSECIALSECMGLSIAIGAGTMSSILFWFSLAGLAPSRIVISLIAIMVFGLFLIEKRFHWLVKIKPINCTIPNFNINYILLIFPLTLLFFLFFAVCIHAIGFPLYEWDAFSIWGLKAKVLYYESLASRPDYFYDVSLSYSHLDYPLGVPFIIAGLYSILGTVNDQWGKIIFPFFFLSFILILYCGFRWKLDRVKALYLVVITAGTGGAIRWAGSGNTDLVLALFYGGGIYYLLRWLDEGERAHLILAILFSYFCAFTKNEGIALGIINMFMMFVFSIVVLRDRRLWISLGFFSVGYFLLLLPWLVWVHDIPQSHENYIDRFQIQVVLQNLHRLKIIIPEMVTHMTLLKYWGGIWSFVIIFAMLGRNAFRHGVVIAAWLLFALHIGMYIFIYIIIPLDIRYVLSVNLDRLLLHIIPAAGFIISFHWAEINVKGEVIENKAHL